MEDKMQVKGPGLLVRCANCGRYWVIDAIEGRDAHDLFVAGVSAIPCPICGKRDITGEMGMLGEDEVFVDYGRAMRRMRNA